MTESLSAKERWLAALRLKPVDRLPFWPKLNAPYAAAQTAPFNGMTAEALVEWTGSDRHAWVGNGLRVSRRACRLESTRSGRTTITEWHVPGGRLRAVDEVDPASQSSHPVEFPVKTAADVRLMTEFVEDQTLDADPVKIKEAADAVRSTGPRAIVCTSAGTTALMDWVQHLAGVENAHYLLSDHLTDVEALFGAMDAFLLRKAALIAESSPADAFYLVENTSTTLVSPAQYRRHCFPTVSRCGEIARKGGRPLILHMCGHLKGLLPDLARLPVEAFEAFTSPTVGNTTLLDGRLGCPDKCLIGGTNAALWIQPAREIIARLEEDLAALPHHRGIVVTSAGVMPPRCPVETVKAVCDWVKRYPCRL